jgi:RNA-binding protein
VRSQTVPLNGKQRRQLRALGHHLDVVVQVGANGVTEGVTKALAQALLDHELVKAKIADDDRESRAASVEKLAQDTGSEVAQTLGKTVLFFKQRKKKPKIKLVE